MNRFIFAVTVLTLGILGWMWYASGGFGSVGTAPAPGEDRLPDMYTCADDVVLELAFADNGRVVEFMTPSGTVVTASEERSDLGMQYRSADGSVVLGFAEDDAVYLEEDGVRTATDCVPVTTDGAPEDTAALRDTALAAASWQWHSTEYTDGSVVTPDEPEAFALTFQTGGQVAVTTDCNSMMGQYELDAEQSIAFAALATTLMYCEGSQESTFREMLEAVQSYRFEDDVLVLEMSDEGVIRFDPIPNE